VKVTVNIELVETWVYQPSGFTDTLTANSTFSMLYYFDPGDSFTSEVVPNSGTGLFTMSNGTDRSPATFTEVRTNMVMNRANFSSQTYLVSQNLDWLAWEGSTYSVVRTGEFLTEWFQMDGVTPIENPCPVGGSGGGSMGNRSFRCNCPDFSREEPLDLSSPFPSRAYGRQWINSRAGSPGDCKHIFGTRRYLRQIARLPGSQPGEPIRHTWADPVQPLGNWDAMETDPNAVRDWARRTTREQRARERAGRRVSANDALARDFFNTRRSIGQLANQRSRLYESAKEDYENYNPATGNRSIQKRINPELLDQEALARIEPQLNAARDRLEQLKERLMTETNQRYSSGAITRDEYERLLDRYELEQ
jgi:hypothetical protein